MEYSTRGFLEPTQPYRLAWEAAAPFNGIMSEATAPPILALVRDLLLSSRISTAARNAGVEVKMVRDPAQLGGVAGRLLLVDLNLAGAIEAAAAWRQASGKQVIGFVAHVDTATIAAAREAGINRVMARGGFFEALPQLLG